MFSVSKGGDSMQYACCIRSKFCLPGADFSFASYYNDHMVLQKSPMRANIWGYLLNRNGVNRPVVSVTLNNKKYNAIYIKGIASLYNL